MEWTVRLETDEGIAEGTTVSAGLTMNGMEVAVAEMAYGETGSRIELTLRNVGRTDAVIRRAGLVFTGHENENGGDWRVFLDNGLCGWCGVKRLDALEPDRRMQPIRAQRLTDDEAEELPFHRSDLQSVIWDAKSGDAWLYGFLRQRYGVNKVDVIPQRGGQQMDRVYAWQELNVRLSPAAAQSLDPFVVSTGDDPYALLEAFGTEVKRHHGRTFEEPPIVGMMTWYGYYTAIDEAIIVKNAEIIGELFSGYPQELQNYMIIDHGWQEDANWGDFSADASRFPHGMAWLAQTLDKYGVKLALWYTPFCVTGNAPNRERLQPLLVRQSEGRIKTGQACVWGDLPGHTADNWPVTYLNGEKDEVQRLWSAKLREMKQWGAKYWKLDFFALQGDADSELPLGELYARTWSTFREAVGEEGHLAPCSCATNLQLGYCDSIRIGADIGESGSWPGEKAMNDYRFGLSTVAALWYKQRNFWVNDADSFQIAKGCSLNEARVRATVVAFSGGHFMVGDDLRSVDRERIEMIRRLTPPLPLAARAVNLFESPFPEGYPSLWSLPLATGFGPMTVLAVFNLTGSTCKYVIDAKMLGIAPDAAYVALEWWQGKWLGQHNDAFEIEVPAEDVAIIHAQPIGDVPSLVSVSHHYTGGYILEEVRFEPETGILSGILATKAGIAMVLYGFAPPAWKPVRRGRYQIMTNDSGGFQCELVTESMRTPFSIPFARTV